MTSSIQRRTQRSSADAGESNLQRQSTGLKRRATLSRARFLFGAPVFNKDHSYDFEKVLGNVQDPKLERFATQDISFWLPVHEPTKAALDRIISDKKTVVVVAHCEPRPDGDAVASTLAVVRKLRALGVDAIGCIDSELRHDLARFVEPGEVVTYEALQKMGKAEPQWVVALDVAERQCLGGAAELLTAAEGVVVTDHHEEIPSRETLGMSPGQELVSQVEPGIDSTAQMITRWCLSDLDELDNARKVQRDISAALILGILSDTDFGRHKGTSLLSLLLAKNLLRTYHGGDLAGLKAQLDTRRPPPEAVALLLGKRQPTKSTQRIEDTRHQVFGDKPYEETVRIRYVPAEIYREALELAGPGFNLSDLLPPVMDAFDDEALGPGQADPCSVSVLVYPQDPTNPSGKLNVSIRSRDRYDASSAAQKLGGNGKPRFAAARRVGAPKEVLGAVLEVLKEQLSMRMRTRSTCFVS